MKFSEFQQEVRTRAKLKRNGKPTNADKLQEAFTLLLDKIGALEREIEELKELVAAPWNAEARAGAG